MTQREQAEQRMRLAKRAFTEACRLALLGDPTAEAKSKEAFQEVQKCREELNRLDNGDA